MDCDCMVCVPVQGGTIHRVGEQHTHRVCGTKQALRGFCEKVHAIVHEACCIESKDYPGTVSQL